LTALLSEALAAVRGLKWHNFELLVAEGFRTQGFSVEHISAALDERPDLVLVKGERRSCVQCRAWQEPSVGTAAVLQLYADMAARNATAGFIVTAGEVGEDAAQLAQARGIQFIKGAKLLAMLDRARETITSGMPAHAKWGDGPLPGARS
jgi:HJR/Mrr/RecB family endonuclease